MKDLTSFLEEELNNTIDEISEIKTSLSKIEIDINTSMSFHHNLNLSKDSTIDFFMSDNEEKSFNDVEISNLDTRVIELRKLQASYEDKLIQLEERLDNIKELINSYSISDSDNYFDYSSLDKNNLVTFINSVDTLYNSVGSFLSGEVHDSLSAISNNNKLAASLLYNDVSRAALELKHNDDIINSLIDMVNSFDIGIITYNSNESFSNNILTLCNKINSDNDLFDFNLVDDYNMSSKINSDIGLSYCKMVNILFNFIISYTNEKFCVTLSFLKTKTKLVFTLDKECDVIKDILSCDDNNNRLVNYYLLINKSFIRFKKNKQNFIIEIENNLY
ncbi:MAG: hypothetical protein ACI4D0_08410 [Lachnospira sp.]